MLSAALPAAAQSRIRFTPPPSEAPGNREAGAVRGTCLESSGDRVLTALLPDTHLGLTTKAYPTFFVYLPAIEAGTVEFVLTSEDGAQVLYSSSYAVANTEGVVSLTLPPYVGAPGLEVGQTYRWSFAVLCPDADQSGMPYVEGTVQRVAVDPALASQLQTALPEDVPVLYAAFGIWHETLSTLAALRRESIDASGYAADWQALLESIDLDAIADQPLH